MLMDDDGSGDCDSGGRLTAWLFITNRGGGENVEEDAAGYAGEKAYYRWKYMCYTRKYADAFDLQCTIGHPSK